MKKDIALLIIDVQVSMFSSMENTSVHESEKVLDNICALIDKARKSDTPVIFIQHTNNEDEEYAEGRRTWHLHPRLQPEAAEKVIRKGTRDSFYQTALQAELQGLGIRKLVIAGMQTEFCVNATCRRAAELGYECILIEDGHSTFDREGLSAAQIIRQYNSELSEGILKLKPAAEIEFDELSNKERGAL